MTDTAAPSRRYLQGMATRRVVLGEEHVNRVETT